MRLVKYFATALGGAQHPLCPEAEPAVAWHIHNNRALTTALLRDQCWPRLIGSAFLLWIAVGLLPNLQSKGGPIVLQGWSFQVQLTARFIMPAIALQASPALTRASCAKRQTRDQDLS